MTWDAGSVLYLPKRDDCGNFCAQEELLTPIRSRDKLLHKSRQNEKRAWSFACEGPFYRIFTRAKYVPNGSLEVIHLSNRGAEVV